MRGFALTMSLIVSVAASAYSAAALELTSQDIPPDGRLSGEQAFNGWGCTGQNLSPALDWSDVPVGTKSFAISLYDPDAPTGSGFWHWWVADIPAQVRSLPKGAGDGKRLMLPAGAIEVRNDFSAIGYGGPCPIKGTSDHYIFRIYALDVEKLDIDENVSPAVVGFNVHAHALATATLATTCGR